jgi:hypothetical protein
MRQRSTTFLELPDLGIEYAYGEEVEPVTGKPTGRKTMVRISSMHDSRMVNRKIGARITSVVDTETGSVAILLASVIGHVYNPFPQEISTTSRIPATLEKLNNEFKIVPVIVGNLDVAPSGHFYQVITSPTYRNKEMPPVDCKNDNIDDFDAKMSMALHQRVINIVNKVDPETCEEVIDTQVNSKEETSISDKIISALTL